MKMTFMDFLGRFIEKRAPMILVVVILLSIFFVSLMPRLSFKTDIRGFLPDNPMSDANDRVMDYYGDAPSIHFLLVRSTNRDRNVLTPGSLKQQYRVIHGIRELDGVDETMSMADIVNILYQYNMNISGSGEVRVNESRNIGEARGEKDYEEIQAKVDLMFGILNGTYGEDFLVMLKDKLPMFSESSLDNVRMLINLLFSRDFSLDEPRAEATIIIVNLNGSLANDELKELVTDIHSITDDMAEDLVDIELSHTGEYQITTEIDRATRDTMGLIVAAIFVVIAIMLFIGFRRASYVVLPLAILMLATVWTFGTAYLLGLKFSATMVGVIPLIFGLGVDYPVHVSERYQEELVKGKDISESLRTAMKHVGGAIAICAISTAIGFFSNVFSDVEPVRVFGITCAIGTSYAFLLTLFFYFPSRFILDKRSKKNPLLPHKLKKLEKQARDSKKKIRHPFFTKLSYKRPIGITTVTIVITVLAVLGALDLESEFSMKDFLPEEWESIRTEEKIFELFQAGSYTQSFILVESDSVASTGVYGEVIDTVRNIEDDPNIVSVSSGGNDSMSLTEGVPRLAEMLHSLDPARLADFHIEPDGAMMDNCTDGDIAAFFDFVYDNTTEIEPLTGQTLGEHTRTLLHRNERGEYDSTVIRIYVNIRTSEDARLLHRDLKADVPGDSEADYFITGGMLLNIATLDSLQTGQIKATLITIAVIGLMLIIVYRRLSLGLIPLIPVLFSTTWIMGAMYVLGMSINVLTVTVTSLGIGMGVDYAVHVSERFREELADKKVNPSIRETIGNLWRPLSISSMTTIAGFSVLLLTPIPIMAQYGIICAFSLLFSYTAAMFLLPVVLVVWGRRREGKEGHKKDNGAGTGKGKGAGAEKGIGRERGTEMNGAGGFKDGTVKIAASSQRTKSVTPVAGGEQTTITGHRLR